MDVQSDFCLGPLFFLIKFVNPSLRPGGKSWGKTSVKPAVLATVCYPSDIFPIYPNLTFVPWAETESSTPSRSKATASLHTPLPPNLQHITPWLIFYHIIPLYAKVARIKEDNIQAFLRDVPLLDKDDVIFVAEILHYNKRVATWVIKFPALGYKTSLSDRAWIHHMAITLQFLREKSNLWVPKVYAYDISHDNAFKSPYVVMSWIPGKPLAAIWNDPAWLKKREFIMLQIAEHMNELSKLTFEKIGCLSRDANGCFTISGIPTDYSSPTKTANDKTTLFCGPFDCTTQYLRHLCLKKRKDNDRPVGIPLWDIFEREKECVDEGLLRFLRACVMGILHEDFEKPPFMLSVPALDSGNILVNEDGMITGYIGWGKAIVAPVLDGCLRYPKWLMKDWDLDSNEFWREEMERWEFIRPFADEHSLHSEMDMKKYRQLLEGSIEVEQILRQRNFYLRALQRISIIPAKMTRISHVFWAIERALMMEDPKMARTLVDRILEFLYGVRDWEKDTEKLQQYFNMRVEDVDSSCCSD
ncbi:hypothetical protein RUND412_009961 [Rhizina undulata]